MSDDIDNLMNEYKEAAAPVKAAEPAPIQPLLEAIKPLAEFTRRKMAEEQQAEVKQSVNDAVSVVKKAEGLEKVPERIITGLLHAAYADDPQFRAAYDGRQANPQALQAELAKIASSLSEDMKGLAVSEARSDVEAAKAAVRSSGEIKSGKDAVDPSNLFHMSDTEFRAYKQKLGSMN